MGVQPDLLMLDPSFLLSREGADLLGDYEFRRQTVIPLAFMAWMQEGGSLKEILPLVAPDDVDELAEHRGDIWELFSLMQTFSAQGIQLAEHDEDVLLTLRERGDPISMMIADEWAFLQSHSWAVAKLPVMLDAFRDAGAAVVQYGRKLRDEMIKTVIPQTGAPPAMTPQLLATAAAKWIVLGGAGAAGAAIGTVGGAMIGSGVAIPVVRAFDP
jgi:hypothetical protein